MDRPSSQREALYDYCAGYLLNALKDCGVPETDQLRSDVSNLSHATRVLDDLVDTPSGKNDRDKNRRLYLEGRFDQIAQGEDLKVLTAMNDVLRRRDSKEYVQVLLKKIFEIQEHIRLAINPDQYFGLLEDEGVEYSKIIIASLRGDTNEEFHRVCAPLIQSMYVFDSLLDGAEDYENGEICVKPDLRFYIIGTRLFTRKFGDLFSSYPNKIVVFKECIKRMYALAIGLVYGKKFLHV